MTGNRHLPLCRRRRRPGDGQLDDPGAYDGTKQIVDGTGKYARITGHGTCKGTDLKSPGAGMDLFLTDVELDFQIKPPTQ